MTSNLTDWSFANSYGNYCSPRLRYACNPPLSACALDFRTSRWFCCNHDDYCWNDIANCATDGSTFECKNNDSKSQATWCCKTDREICNENRDYSCLSTLQNLLNDIPETLLIATYSNLTETEVSATLSFDPYVLIAEAHPTPTSTSSSSTATTTVMATVSTTATTSLTATASPIPSSEHHHLGGGAVAGIVIGVLIAVAMIGSAVWWCLMKQRRSEEETPAREIQQREPVLGYSGLSATSRQPDESLAYQTYRGTGDRGEFGSTNTRV